MLTATQRDDCISHHSMKNVWLLSGCYLGTAKCFMSFKGKDLTPGIYNAGPNDVEEALFTSYKIRGFYVGIARVLLPVRNCIAQALSWKHLSQMTDFSGSLIGQSQVTANMGSIAGDLCQDRGGGTNGEKPKNTFDRGLPISTYNESNIQGHRLI